MTLLAETVQVEERYQEELGIAAAQERIDTYMRTHTTSHQALLDPTSRVNPYPSTSVVVLPKSFGLGGSLPEVVEKVARRHPEGVDLADSLLLSSKYRWVEGLSWLCRSFHYAATQSCWRYPFWMDGYKAAGEKARQTLPMFS